MTLSAAQAQAFFDELGTDSSVWTIEDEEGIPAPLGSHVRRVMPFWSRRSRAEKIIRSVPAYASFRPIKIPREHFTSRWLPDIKEDGILAGVNWSSANATAYDLTPDEVHNRLTA